MNAPQGSGAWLAERAGHVTASRFKDVLAKIKTGEAATRKAYKIQLVTERLTGLPVESFKNAAMEWGTAQEPVAREAYEASTGVLVDTAGFLKHPAMKWCGGSPDGLIGEDGGIEIKCPHNSTVHVETLMGGMPSDHVAQVQGNLWITGRQWWDFVSFDPRMPERLQIYVQRIERDDKYIAVLQAEVKAFLFEVEALHARLMG